MNRPFFDAWHVRDLQQLARSAFFGENLRLPGSVRDEDQMCHGVVIRWHKEEWLMVLTWVRGNLAELLT
jgi:hypothetical protein